MDINYNSTNGVDVLLNFIFIKGDVARICSTRNKSIKSYGKYGIEKCGYIYDMGMY